MILRTSPQFLTILISFCVACESGQLASRSTSDKAEAKEAQSEVVPADWITKDEAKRIAIKRAKEDGIDIDHYDISVMIYEVPVMLVFRKPGDPTSRMVGYDVFFNGKPDENGLYIIGDHFSIVIGSHGEVTQIIPGL